MIQTKRLCPQIDMNITHAHWQRLYGRADRSVNKQCGTSERCVQDCEMELRMWSMEALLEYRSMNAQDWPSKGSSKR